jgi:tetratricopeptide (TPR) repeat protein
VVALSALALGALSIAITLAASDTDKWPGWLQPFHRWGWWSVLVLLVTAVVLAIWQTVRQPPITPASPTIHAAQGSLAAGHDVTITGAHGPTAGRDAQTVTGGTAPTAGRDLHITHIASVPESAPALASTVGPVTNLPPRNLAFTGRDELLGGLHQQLSRASAAATALAGNDAEPGPADLKTSQAQMHAPRVLHGLGGVGKTYLALEYAHRHARRYRIRWWVAAEQPAAIPAQLAALSRQLGIPEQTNQSETVAALLAELSRRDGWLLIFDNAEDPHDLHPYWPSTDAGGRVLVTSRNPNWQPLAVTVAVDVWPRTEAIAFLQHRPGLNQHDADRLAGALGDLPLALEQAAAYLEQTTTPPGEYLDLLTTRAQELFALGRPATSEQTVATVWSVSLQRVNAQAPAAQELLCLCAFLAPDDIPRALLHEHLDVLPEPLAAAVGDPLAFGQVLAALGRYSLIAVADDALRLHRLVQAVTRYALAQDQQRQWAAIAVHMVLAAFPDRAEDPNTWPAVIRLLAHALTITNHPAPAMIDPRATVQLLHRVTDYLWGRSEYIQARPLAERALEISEAGLGPEHRDTATSLHNLARILRAQGDFGGARTLNERALAIRSTHLGPDHPDTATSLHNLAIVLRDQGDFDGARVLHERGLAIREACLRSDHPDIAWSLNNLAAVVRAQGDLDGARTLHERALAIREASLGPEHPDTAWSLGNLAIILRSQGDLERARLLSERALAIREARLGSDHPDTAWSLNYLAIILRDQGDLDGARTLHERALGIRQARLRPDHPDIAWSLNNLAVVLQDQGNLGAARTLHERALAIREASLGPEHLTTVHSRERLAAVVAALEEHG